MPLSFRQGSTKKAVQHQYVSALLLDHSFSRDRFSKDCFLRVSLSLAPPDSPLSGSLVFVLGLQVHYKQAVCAAPHEGIVGKHRVQDVQASTPLSLRR
jgi:hypothetical protein